MHRKRQREENMEEPTYCPEDIVGKGLLHCAAPKKPKPKLNKN